MISKTISLKTKVTYKALFDWAVGYPRNTKDSPRNIDFLILNIEEIQLLEHYMLM